ncbi:MAG: serine/threonine-protein kinase, partial [Pseudomonadota bacterium]
MKFGQYELLERVAVGGMAEVYRGRVAGAEGFEKFVAIKRILPEFARDERFISMLLTEARIHSALSHRNIVQIHDLGISEDGEYFIVLEYVEGHDLRAVMEAAAGHGVQIPDSIALYIADELAQALHFAHELRGADGQPLGIIHRDVSPSNVLISFSGEVKLSDFGIAKRRHDHSVVGSLKGNLAYMSPEQAQRSALDRRTDLFSLGAVLHEMVTGHKLREITDELEGWREVASGVIRPARELRPDLPESFDWLLSQALAADPKQRFADAEAFGNAVRGVRRDLGVPVGPAEVQELLQLLDPPRRARTQVEISKVIRLGPEFRLPAVAAVALPTVGVVLPPAEALAAALGPRPRTLTTPGVTPPPPPARKDSRDGLLRDAKGSSPSAAGTPPPRAAEVPAASRPTPPPTPPPRTPPPPPPLGFSNDFSSPFDADAEPTPVFRPHATPNSVLSANIAQGMANEWSATSTAVAGTDFDPAFTPPPPPFASAAATPSTGLAMNLSSAATPPPPVILAASAMGDAPSDRSQNGRSSSGSYAPIAPVGAPGGIPQGFSGPIFNPAPNTFSGPLTTGGAPAPFAKKKSVVPRVLVVLVLLLGGAAAAVHTQVMPLNVAAVWLKPGRLLVRSDPAGATVKLDGRPQTERTPLSIDVKRDRAEHVLELSRDGSKPATRTIRLDRTVVLEQAFDLEALPPPPPPPPPEPTPTEAAPPTEAPVAAAPEAKDDVQPAKKLKGKAAARAAKKAKLKKKAALKKKKR